MAEPSRSALVQEKTSDRGELLAWMDAINRLGVAVNGQRDLPGLLQLIARTACELLDFDSCSILLVDSARQSLRVVASAGLSDEYVALINGDAPLLLSGDGPLAGSPSTQAYLHDDPVIVDDIQGAPGYQPWAMAAEEHGHKSMTAVPLHNQGETIGTINVYGRVPRQLGRGGLELLQVLANHAGIALETSAQLERERARVSELSELNTALEQRTDQLQRHSAIHDRFIEIVRRGGGVMEIATALANVVDRAVAVQDVTGNSLGSVSRAGLSVTPPDWAAWASPDRGGTSLLPELISHASPMSTSERYPGLLAGPVLGGTEALGILWLAGRPVEDPLHLRAIEQASVALGLELLRQRAAKDAEWQVRGDLGSDLIRGAFTDHRSVIDRGDHLGSDLRVPHSVVIVTLATDEDRTSTRLVQHVRSLVQTMTGPRPITASRDGAVVVLIPRGTAPSDAEFAQRVLDTSPRMLGEAVRVSLSEPARSLEGLPAAYRQARGLLKLYPPRAVEPLRTVPQAGMIGMLLADIDPERVAALAERWVGPLHNYDQARSTELVTTLRTYLDTDLNTAGTAAALYIHPNTVLLRLKRVRALLDIDLTSVNDLTTMRTALTIDRIVRGR